MNYEEQMAVIRKVFKTDNIMDAFKPLYHYTSIGSLALILSSNRIKLNCLKYVDDKTEGTAKDLGDIRQYFFASCWTDIVDESIPFWQMYTNNMKGVRISLPKYPFKLHEIKYKLKYLKGDLGYSFLSEDQLVNNDFMIIGNNSFLEKIEYTTDLEKLSPMVFSRSERGGLQYSFGKIGKFKNKLWEFQSEYRYLTIALPGGGILTYDKKDTNSIPLFHRAIQRKEALPVDALYLDLVDGVLDNLEITLGPKTDRGDRILLECLVDKYCPKAKIKESVLIGKL